ncbi:MULTISPECIES: SMP-30/gluconolactonase/LRE family protein [Sphingomonas]|jgi:xylono-1,5-lactonase|uniref:SMP-30/gluconolactonase/LRE family protein n=1 Tax=Sphingomonas zeae TaxID=1646122 RepID=A0A7Y6EFP6_9SPHN|nr:MULTISPECIES: SMP-30/gluconolactonase/LRE family protein [Sphingomonas]MBB4050136.1 sugar lactone lactonase YvrE [Sphingomonas zeae]MDK8188268.1 SMP-30/gluconolactonase/LRE family protein [Sphingomonas zeae]MDK8218181.1 SMP-30/gluconolactonase/LRE family protein [Sphingomonas sp. UMB7805-LC452B]NUU45605.1 SMP-30/gluconolactonase/LRE family protein [Sphingomonas zeae]
MQQAEHCLTVGATLGEGPIWVDDALWFVDIKQQRIYRHDPVAGTLDHWASPEMVGWVVPAQRGGFVAGLKSGPHHFDPATGSFEQLAEIDAHLPANRLNDACVDGQGRIWFGTMDNDETSLSGRLFQWSAGRVTPTAADPVCITNGPAISPDDSILYHVDTLGKVILAHPILADGTLGAASEFARFGGADGHPDGAICDAEGGVWVGFFGGSAARRYGPDGVMTDEVRFPVSNITKIALGGPDGRTAYATTARQGLSDEQLAEQLQAGDIFTFRVAVPAKPVHHAAI